MIKEIPGYPHYLATDDGHIISRRTHSRMSEMVNNGGYLKVAIWENKRKSQQYVHRLVALAFLPNPEMLPEVNHKDEDKKNNAASNLEWCSPAYNMTYGKAPKVRARKRAIPVVCVETGKTYQSIREASKAAGVNVCSISLCARGKAKSAGGLHWKFQEV